MIPLYRIFCQFPCSARPRSLFCFGFYSVSAYCVIAFQNDACSFSCILQYACVFFVLFDSMQLSFSLKAVLCWRSAALGAGIFLCAVFARSPSGYHHQETWFLSCRLAVFFPGHSAIRIGRMRLSAFCLMASEWKGEKAKAVINPFQGTEKAAPLRGTAFLVFVSFFKRSFLSPSS